MSDLATVDDIITLKRALTASEQERAHALLPAVSAILRDKAKRAGKDLDSMISTGELSVETVTSVVADIVMRELNVPASEEAATQVSQSALGYTLNYSPLSPGGGLFIKRAELERLGLRRQQVRNRELI